MRNLSNQPPDGENDLPSSCMRQAGGPACRPAKVRNALLPWAKQDSHHLGGHRAEGIADIGGKA
jgi:hypothetical protein